MAYQKKRSRSGKRTSTVSHKKAHTRKVGVNKYTRVRTSKAVKKR